MFRLAVRRALGSAKHIPKPLTWATASSNSITSPIIRFYGNANQGQGFFAQQETVARQMIQYALNHARSQKSDESYAQAFLVLEQGLSNLQAGGGDPSEDAVGMLMLAMSTLLYERGELENALEQLQMVPQLVNASLPVKIAALESQIGIQLEKGEDDAPRKVIADGFQLVKTEPGVDGDVVTSRAKAIRGLADLVLGDLKSAELNFGGHNYKLGVEKDKTGNTTLSYGEYLHATGNFELAKDHYKKAINVLDTTDVSGISHLAAANMVPEEVILGATCALGQLLSQSGNFQDAEEFLTKALTKAENHFGSTHPKVGVVLTCIAFMFKHKAKVEASSAILIQEGLYRRALDLLKAPALDSEVKDILVERSDIVALARGGYAEILSIQQNRKGEGERMRKWSEATWRNNRLSLVQALEFSEPSQAAVIDTRIGRVI